MLGEKAIIRDGVVVAEEKDFAARGFYAEAAGGSCAAIFLTDVMEIGVGKCKVTAEGFGVCERAIVDDNDLPSVGRESLKSECSKAEAKLVRAVISGDNNGEVQALASGFLISGFRPSNSKRL